MIGVISNPKKSLQIEKPISDVKAAIEYLYLYTTKYKMYYQSRTSVPQGGGGGGFGGGGGRGMGGGVLWYSTCNGAGLFKSRL